MTITINLTEQDVAQASKSLIGLIQSCAEIDLPDTPHTATTGGSIIVPEKVYKDEPVPSPVKPAPKEKPKSEPAAPPQAELIATEPPAEEDSKPDETTVNYAELRKNLKAECTAIARTGKSAGLKQLLVDYGVKKFSELPDDKLEEFRTAAKAL